MCSNFKRIEGSGGKVWVLDFRDLLGKFAVKRVDGDRCVNFGYGVKLYF